MQANQTISEFPIGFRTYTLLISTSEYNSIGIEQHKDL